MQSQRSDNQLFQWKAYGAPIDNAPAGVVLALHGTPGSRLKYAPAHEAALSRGLCILAVDRWGYGGTRAPPGPTLEAFGKHIEAFLDTQGVVTCQVVGISGGGPFAAAVAAVLGDRVSRLALVAPVGVILTRSDGREQIIPLSLFHRFCFRGIARWPIATQLVFRAYNRILALSPRTGIGIAMARSGPADRRLLADAPTVGHLAAMMREGLKAGGRGPAIDLELFSMAWDFDPGRITAPTRIWFGDQDGSVPPVGITALGECIPRAEVVHVTGQGHFWIATRFGEVLDWLASPTS